MHRNKQVAKNSILWHVQHQMRNLSHTFFPQGSEIITEEGVEKFKKENQ